MCAYDPCQMKFPRYKRQTLLHAHQPPNFRCDNNKKSERFENVTFLSCHDSVNAGIAELKATRQAHLSHPTRRSSKIATDVNGDFLEKVPLIT